MDVVRHHYNRFPYPPVPRVALPRAGGAPGIAWETGRGFVGDPDVGHKGIRILVAGAGTLEALVVAQQHPRASEVVAVDLSAASLSLLRQRTLLARVACYTLGLGVFRRVAPIQTVEADLATWEDPTGFDYIIATNVLHHHAEPMALLARLAGMLKEGGLLRLTTYPRASRFWPRAIGRWLRAGGITAETSDLVRVARSRVEELEPDHPIRLAFEDNPESRHRASLSDAYLHPVELPQPPLEWGRVAATLGLRLAGEGQHPLSRSAVLHELCPESEDLDPWVKLQVLDDLMEMGSNPVLWLDKTGAPVELNLPAMPRPEGSATGRPPGPGEVLSLELEPAELLETWRDERHVNLWLPSDLHWEMAQGTRRAGGLLGESAVDKTLAAAARLFGSRVSIRDARRELPGLTLHERDLAQTLDLPQAWGDPAWAQLDRQLGPQARLTGPDGEAEGETLVDQARDLQLRSGARRPWTGPLTLSA